MPPILLQPPAASALVLALFAGLIGGYLLVAHGRDRVSRLVGLGFSCLALAQLAAASVYTLTTDAVTWGNATERLLIHATLFLALAFAYRFRGNPFAGEARAAAVLSGVVWAALAAATVFVLLAHARAYPFPWESALFVLWAGWGIVVCLRKARHFEREATGRRPSWRRLRDPRARTLRALALWFGLIIVPGLFSTLSYAGLMDHQAFYSGYLGLQFAAHVYFAAMFFRHTPEPSSFSAKVTAVSLMTVLAVVGAGSLIVQTPRSLAHDAGIRLPEGRGYRLTPAAGGGYAVSNAPAAFDPADASPLPLSNFDAARIALPFAFPFHGRTYREAWIHDDGLVAFGPVAPHSWSHVRRLPEAPVVAPLYADFNPEFGGAVTLARTPDRVVVTWEDVRGLRNLSPSTFEVVLHRDGRIDLTYGRLGLVPTNALRAVHPGGPGAGALPFPEAQAALPAGQTLLDDYALVYRAFAHPREARLAWIILVSVALILALFPLLIHAYVVRPVEALAEGVARMTAGERAVRVPVLYRDEVGALADGFNRMAGTLAEREAALRDLNASLEVRVAEQTAELRRANGRLRALDEAKSRFFANVSHEFRTPLTLLLGPLEQLLDDPALPPERRRDLTAMQRSARRLLALVEQLLDLARLDAGEVTLRPRPGDLAAWADHLADVFVPLAERHGVTLRRRIRLAHPCRRFDADVLEKIVSNLLANALKFTPRGGRVALRVREDGADVVFLVEDEGPGVAPGDAERLFDRFFQADGAHGGAGLGLALVRELAEACGGTVHVESEPGVGSAFEVRLPLPAASEGATDSEINGARRSALLEPVHHDDEAGEDEGPASPPGAPAVLVVEDHPDLRAFLRRALAPHYRVLEAADGEAAWALARTRRPDLILTDVMMPSLDGHALVARLKADPTLQHTPVVVLTAKTSETDRVAGLTAGVDDYLFKPFHVETLLARLANVLARHRTLRDRFSQTFRLEASSVEVTPTQKAFLDCVREAVEARMADPALSVETLAEDVGASRRSLERALKAVGTTPLSLIRRMRMQRAADLLAQRYGSIKQVAAAVGHAHAGKFAADFKRVHGLTPTEYLARLG